MTGSVAAMHSVLEIVRKTTGFLAERGVGSPRLNAEHLVGHALGLKRMELYLQFERLLSEPELERLRPLVRRRGQREPLQYILGDADFHGLRLKVDRRALIPRPETERLVELVTQSVPVPPATALDFGTGSGAIALALARHWPEARFTAVDRSLEALALARENAQALGLAARVEFLQSDWGAALPGGVRFDVIVANPPYLSAAETAAAEPEVRAFEPAEALVADEDGLGALRRIVAEAPARLTPGGLLALETGIDQHKSLALLLTDAGFARFDSHPDLTGRDRFIFAWRA
jgi:release factor glutamine methyltransferase